MKENDERIARELGEWIEEDTRAALERFRSSGFQDRLRLHPAPPERGTERSPWRRRLILAGAAGAVLLAALAIMRLHRPGALRPGGPESIRLFLANHANLSRLQAGPGAVGNPPELAGGPAGATPLSRRELSGLLRHILPERVRMSVRPESQANRAAPPAFRQTIDRFFTDNLKFITEETNG
jgi:hypothetical protein